MTDRTCSIDGCKRPWYCRGWCTLHYQRWRSHGTTADPRRQPNPDGRCLVAGCSRPERTRGWCGTHYSRWLRQGSVEDPQPKLRDPCSAEGCGRPATALGWCDMHYLRWYRHGSTDDPIPRCAVDGCDRRVLSNDVCQKHRWRRENHGSFELPGAKPPFGTKWCRKCERYLPRSEFYANARKGGRLESPCKACRAAVAKEYLKNRPSRSRLDRNRRRRALMQGARSEPY